MTTPNSSDEGFQHLETLLGSYVPKDNRQFRTQTKNEMTSPPEAGKPALVTASDGEVIWGSPYRVGGSASFDLIESVNRNIYEVNLEGLRTRVQGNQRYMVARFSLRVDDAGLWDFDAVLTAHSIPWVIGQPYLKGSVKWLPNGIELLGIGTDNILAADQSFIRVATYGQIRLTREGEELTITDKWQTYHLGTDVEGNALPIPDFTKAIGPSATWLSGTARK